MHIIAEVREEALPVPQKEITNKHTIQMIKHLNK